MATVFQKQVWQKISLVPQGKITTYKILAKALGRPKASRAVAKALRKNPKLVQIPCHRVVRSNGEVGGYVKGVRGKVRLLRKEGVEIERAKVKDFNNRLYKFDL